jgi:altronate hydrolase
MNDCQTSTQPVSNGVVRSLKLHPSDDVAVLLDAADQGRPVAVADGVLPAQSAIPKGHKIALRAMQTGEPVRKYGEVIGFAACDIMPGEWVHTHNLRAGVVRPLAEARAKPAALAVGGVTREFLGYRRPDGRVGTRNALAIISTVNCSADAAHILATRARSELLPRYPGVDDVFCVTHESGCGLPIGGPCHSVLMRCLNGMAAHANVAGVVVMSLGCEVVDPDEVGQAARAAGKPCVVIRIQDAGGVGSAVRKGMLSLEDMAAQAGTFRRTPCPISALVIGTNCGGSDAYSGITANPMLGQVGDLLMAAGCRWVLAESPETRGAEHILARRAVSDDVAERLLAIMERWDAYTAAYGATVDNNPAPGNKEGGITTIYEKALGAAMKGGTAPLADVIEYAAEVKTPGLTFMDTPGMDDVSVTGLVAGGCNLVAFTTGRGSCLAFKPVPVIKIATTTDLFERMPEDMDFDAGALLSGVGPEHLRDNLIDLIIAVAEGRKTAGEQQGLGEHTFAPWALGPTL